MYKHIIYLLFLLFHINGIAQENYFQQEVNVAIDVTLNDSTHTLDGAIEIEYINNSPDELHEIYMHLWANAYKNRSTAFAKQKVTQGSSKFYFAKDKDLGRFRDLDFKINGLRTEWNFLKGKADIAIIKLGTPLKSGERLKISTPLKLQIPASFSRLGHVGQSYQLTQWYPKPAVYDRDGWHPMSYVDMGEFYSEFGSFDVKITLPENYVVGSTGTFDNKKEEAFLQQRVAETARILTKLDDDALKALKDTFPESSSVMKTLHYTADNVHDFAWFADKRFYVQKSEVKLASGQMVDTWAMFTNAESWLWRKGIFYVDRSVKFYSDHVGEYPYPHATAVQSALSAGGGMEYPMITVIGLMGDPQALDGVITHEVGHNWFYGILAFDEREHPWMDEGMNSYYDHRYTEDFYGSSNIEFLPDFIMKGSDMTLLELAYLYQARRNLDQAPETPSEDFALLNYFLGGYEKPAVCFKWLEKYLGTPKFDEIMKSFYDTWKFKHPQPEDLRTHFTSRTNKNLDWFFDGLIGSNDKTDYAFTGINEGETFQLGIKNKGELNTPFPVSALKNDSIVQTKWYDGFEGKQQLDFPKGDYDELVIDKEKVTLDVYRKNNKIRTSGLFPKMPPLQLKFLTGIENPDRTRLYWLPTITYNHYDKLMLGLGVYNITLPAKRFEFSVAPMYSFETKQFNGLGNVKFHTFPETDAIRKVTLDLGAKKFSYNYNDRDDYHVEYTRLAPAINVELGTKFNKAFTHEIYARALFIEEEIAEFVTLIDSINFDEETMTFDTVYRFGVYNGNVKENSKIYELSYSGGNARAVNPYSYKIALEQQNYTDAFERDQKYFKASLTLNTSYTYNVGKQLDFRIFFGYFAQNSRREAGNVSNRGTRGSYALTHQGYNDYKYDHFHLGRNENNGIWSQQVNMEEGGMKNAFGSAFDGGQSNDFIFAVNFKGDLPQSLPLNLPVKPYFDIGYFSNRQPIASEDSFSDQLWWSGGVMLEYKNALSIHFPIFNSKNLKTLYDQRSEGKYAARITWRVDLNKANPFQLMNMISP